MALDTLEAAEAALDAAMDADGSGEHPTSQPFDLGPGNGFDPANEGISQGDAPIQNAPPATPDAPAETVTPVTAESFTEKFDPNTLPEELLPAYKSMQADYTRKTQGLAERARQFEQYGDLDIETAAQLMQRVSTPEGLAAFTSEATEWLQSQGYSAQEAQVAVEQSLQQPADDPFAGLDTLVADDPDLAPLAQAVKALQAEVASVRTEQQSNFEAERQRTETMQVLGELQRMENFIRTENPQYDDQDVENIYELAAYYDGNLIQAQERYEQQFAQRLGRYLQSKGTPAGVQPVGTPGGPPVVDTDFDPLDPKQAHAAALELVRRIESEPDA
jgi:hypothetical protein